MAALDLKELEKNELILIVAPSEKTQEISLQVLRYFLNAKNASCVYVTVAKPYATIMNILRKNKINSVS